METKAQPDAGMQMQAPHEQGLEAQVPHQKGATATEAGAPEGDVVDAVVKDHREVEELFAQMEDLPASATQELRELTDRVIWELVRHSVSEEVNVYPTARRVIPGGGELIERELSEQADAERIMKQLEGMDPSDPKFCPILNLLIKTVREHIKGEESITLPKLREHLSESELKTMASTFQATKKVAPTRPHPEAPDRPPFNILLGPGIGLVDRIRDYLSGRGQQGQQA